MLAGGVEALLLGPILSGAPLDTSSWRSVRLYVHFSFPCFCMGSRKTFFFLIFRGRPPSSPPNRDKSNALRPRLHTFTYPHMGRGACMPLSRRRSTSARSPRQTDRSSLTLGFCVSHSSSSSSRLSARLLSPNLLDSPVSL